MYSLQITMYVNVYIPNYKPFKVHIFKTNSIYYSRDSFYCLITIYRVYNSFDRVDLLFVRQSFCERINNLKSMLQ